MLTNKATQPIREEKNRLMAPHYYNTEQSITQKTERINVFTSTNQEILVAWFPMTPNVIRVCAIEVTFEVCIVMYLSDINEPKKSRLQSVMSLVI